jgi:hypothetical protein
MQLPFDTPIVRVVVVVVALIAACLAGLLDAGDARAAAPTLRVVSGPSLAIAGTGFVPRTMVRVRLVGPSTERTVRVRTGPAGGFVARFALERCSLTAITASGLASRSARVPTTWFVRECPPPPPLAPGANPDS